MAQESHNSNHQMKFYCESEQQMQLGVLSP